MSEAALSPGARLKAAREQRGLSAQKAADEMHLDRWVIDALEADDYKRIGPTVYAKGHLKKYAALLGLPAEEILAGYESRSHGGGEALHSGAGLMHAPRADAPQARHLKPLPMALSVAAVLLLVGVLWWRPWHQRGPLRSVPQTAAAISSSPLNGLPDKAVSAAGISSAAASPATVRETTPAPVAAPSAPASAAAAPAPAAATPAVVDAAVPGAGHARLRLSFSADSWVDVHDASGHRTFAGTGLANSVKTIAGAAPMRVYLGFGSGVQLEINDRVVAIGPQFFAGDVARFEAGADGVLRRDSRAEQSRGDPSRGDPAHGVQAASARPTG